MCAMLISHDRCMIFCGTQIAAYCGVHAALSLVISFLLLFRS